MSAINPTPQEILFLRRIEQAERLRAHRHSRAPRRRRERPAKVCVPRAGSSCCRKRCSKEMRRGRPLVLGGNLCAGSRPWLLCAAVRRALAFGGWPPRILSPPFPLRIREQGREGRARSDHQLGQHYCPMRNMANSGRKHKCGPLPGGRCRRVLRLSARIFATSCRASGPRDTRARNGRLSAATGRKFFRIRRRTSVAASRTK